MGPGLDEFAFVGEGGRVLLSGVADDVRAEHGKSLDELFKEVFKCSANS
jgi:ABC-2 type transport system ATP-binding protein